MTLALTLGAVPASADDSQPTTPPSGPVAPVAVDVLPDLRVSAAFNKPAYTSDELLKVQVTIENVSTVAATEVRGDAFGDVSIAHDQWGAMHPWQGPGDRLEPGQKVELTLSGHVKDANVGVATLHVSASTKDDANDADNHVYPTTQVTGTRGNYVGTVYGDGNNNGVMDPGEGLSEVELSMFGGVPEGLLEQTTDSAGRFSFHDIPTGRYSIHFRPPGDWIIPHAFNTVDTVDDPDALIRATRPLAETLAAAITFTQDSYALGDTAHLTVTLTNSGPTEFTGITAFCYTGGPDPSPGITSRGPGWGDLAAGAAGVTVPAGQTRSFDVWHIVHEAAFTHGFIVAFCRFGSAPDGTGTPEAEAEARVPGGVGDARGRLVYDRNADHDIDGDGVANTKVILVDESTGEVVARATTEANGHYRFTNAPAGRHEFRVIGPWKLRDANHSSYQILAGRTDDKQPIFVLPGPNQPDPDAPPTTPPTTAPPTQQGGVAPAAQRGGLASTGANVIGLSIAGLVMLVVGVGLVLIRRRRVW